MKLEIHFHQMDSSESIKAHIQQAADKVSRYVNEDDSLKVIVGANGHHQVYAEAFWHDHNERKDLFAKEEANQGQDLYALIDMVFDRVAVQLRKAHDKRVDRRLKKEPLKKSVM